MDDIIYIIANLHNLKEWDSPIKPNSIKSWIVHHADNIAGKIRGEKRIEESGNLLGLEIGMIYFYIFLEKESILKINIKAENV